LLYGIGIFPNAVAVILLRCLYAVQDTVTPLLAEVVDLVFYASIAGLLTRHFGIEGLALTRGLSFFLVTGILVAVLSLKRNLLILDFDFLWFIVKAAVASLAMAVVSWLSLHFSQSMFDSGNTLLRLSIVFLVFVTSTTTFLCVARLLKLSEAEYILSAAADLLPWTRYVPAQ
jgi:peptidoglycan biosynthesis protein MviN/MurJ (putative lipid II flippase)